mmetsp:Transcript_6787/g.21047  ORF Transcript_6787/g.21047 Transcript_6787/m.21047 type:complete len:302 (-) Transcript_6787:6632-7537(-)
MLLNLAPSVASLYRCQPSRHHRRQRRHLTKVRTLRLSARGPFAQTLIRRLLFHHRGRHLPDYLSSRRCRLHHVLSLCLALETTTSTASTSATRTPMERSPFVEEQVGQMDQAPLLTVLTACGTCAGTTSLTHGSMLLAKSKAASIIPTAHRQVRGGFVRARRRLGRAPRTSGRRYRYRVAGALLEPLHRGSSILAHVQEVTLWAASCTRILFETRAKFVARTKSRADSPSGAEFVTGTCARRAFVLLSLAFALAERHLTDQRQIHHPGLRACGVRWHALVYRLAPAGPFRRSFDHSALQRA